VSGVLAEIPPEPAHSGVSVILPVFCGFVFKKMFKSSIKKEQRFSIRISTNSHPDFSGTNAYQNSH
jgi:ribosomal protein L31